MTKYERCEKLWNVLESNMEKAPYKLYKAMLETHSALYSRALHEGHEYHIRTFAFYQQVYNALINDYQKIGWEQRVEEYKMMIRRTEKRLTKKCE